MIKVERTNDCAPLQVNLWITSRGRHSPPFEGLSLRPVASSLFCQLSFLSFFLLV